MELNIQNTENNIEVIIGENNSLVSTAKEYVLNIYEGNIVEIEQNIQITNIEVKTEPKTIISQAVVYEINVETGIRGPAGQGFPAGGKKGETLIKNSDDDFDTKWTLEWYKLALMYSEIPELVEEDGDTRIFKYILDGITRYRKVVKNDTIYTDEFYSDLECTNLICKRG